MTSAVSEGGTRGGATELDLRDPEPADPDHPDRRARRRQRTREQIAEAALRLAAERGYDHVTVDDIAAAVDIAPRTFFRYFASKDDVLFTDHDEKLRGLRDAVAARPADEPVLTSVREALLSLADNFEHDRELIVMKSRLIEQTPSLRARRIERQTEWQDVMAAAVAARLGVDPEHDLRAQVVAATSLAALQAAVRIWLASDGHTSIRALAAEALDVLDGDI